MFLRSSVWQMGPARPTPIHSAASNIAVTPRSNRPHGRGRRAPARRRVRARPPPTRRAPRRTTEIRRVARFIRPFPRSQSLFEGAALISWSMDSRGIIVEGVLAQLSLAAHMARRDARPTAAAVGTGPHGQRRHRASSRPFASERFSPRAPAPVAPPLPAQHATYRSKPDGSARSLAVRCFRPPVACDDRPATTLTADDVRVDDEMVPDPLVDPIAFVTDGGEASRIDLVEKVVHLNAPNLRRRAKAELGVEGIRLVGTDPQ